DGFRLHYALAHAGGSAGAAALPDRHRRHGPVSRADEIGHRDRKALAGLRTGNGPGGSRRSGARGDDCRHRAAPVRGWNAGRRRWHAPCFASPQRRERGLAGRHRSHLESGGRRQVIAAGIGRRRDLGRKEKRREEKRREEKRREEKRREEKRREEKRREEKRKEHRERERKRERGRRKEGKERDREKRRH